MFLGRYRRVERIFYCGGESGFFESFEVRFLIRFVGVFFGVGVLGEGSGFLVSFKERVVIFWRGGVLGLRVRACSG